MDNRLIEADSQNLIIENVELFKQIPRVKESWETMFSRCITRQYRTFFGYEGDKAVLVVFFSTNVKSRKNKIAHICGVFGRKKMQQFIERFYKQLKEEGYTSITAYSKLPEKTFERITRLKKSYSVYHNKL